VVRREEAFLTSAGIVMAMKPEPASDAINLAEKFAKFSTVFTPHIIAEVNDFYVLLAKLDGEFVEHRHDEEDELFLVVSGQLKLRMNNRTVLVNPGEVFVVPRGTDHLPSAKKGTQVLLLERKSTKHTGKTKTERTITEYARI
jgi:mannose-6-phosphate isomerase-like protein (cupin superfamily)